MKDWLRNIFKDKKGMGTVEVILIIVEIFIPYYQVCIRCIK